MSENASEAEGSTATKAESNELTGTPSVNASTENAEDLKAPKPKTKKIVSSRKHSKKHDSKRNSKTKEKWGLLLPYLDNSELTSSSAEPSEIHYEYKSRITANQIVEPHISYKMDHILPDLLTKEIESWRKKLSAKTNKNYSAKRMSFPPGPKVRGKRPERLKKKKHSFDEENKHDYFETRRIFFNLHLDVLKSQKALYQATMKTALLFYMGLSKGSVTAIKELTDYYCN